MLQAFRVYRKDLTMKVACITRFEQFHPRTGLAARLEDEVVRAGHSYARIDPGDIKINYDGENFPLWHPTLDFNDFDLFDHALRLEDMFSWEVIDCLREWGHTVLRTNRVVSDDKITMARLFSRYGIKTPRTTVLDNLAQAEVAAAEFGWPVVGKARKGSQGRTIRLIEDTDQLTDFIDMALDVAPNFLLQEVIRPMGSDIRLFVVGKRVVAAMKRYAPEGDFRSNYSLSKRADPYTPSAEEEQLAVRVAELYQANYAGVDVMYSGGVPYVLEINKLPGLNIEEITGVNVAAEIVKFYENQLKKG